MTKYKCGLDNVISTSGGNNTYYNFSSCLLVKVQRDLEGSPAYCIEFLYQNGSEDPYNRINDHELINMSWSPAGNLLSCEDEDYLSTYIYTDYKNKLNVDLIAWRYGLVPGDLLDSFVFKSVVSTYLSSRFIEVTSYGAFEERYTYKFDNEGYPTEIKIATPDGEWYEI